jgi:hypothetical protein
MSCAIKTVIVQNQSSLLRFAAVSCTIGLAACSNSSATGESAVVSEDGGAEAASPTEQAFTLLVLKGAPPFNEVAPRVTVLFDKPGGERVELQTGPDGRVTVDAVDWSKGPASFSLLADGCIPSSFVEITKAALPAMNARVPAIAGTPMYDVAVFTSRQPPALPSLSGAISHARGPLVYVSPTSYGGYYVGASDAYKLSAVRDAPFSFVSLELSKVAPPTVGPRGAESKNLRWTKIDVPPATIATFDMDLDLATELTPVKVKGRVVITGGRQGSLGGQSTFAGTVSSMESQGSAVLGLASRFDVSADESAFEVDFEYVKIDGVTPIASYSIGQPNLSVSTAFVSAWPSQDFVVDRFLMVPVIAGPTSRSLDAPYSLADVAPDSLQNVDLYDAKTYRWHIEVPVGVTTFTPPRLDGKLQAAVGKPTQGVLSTYASYDRSTQIHQRSARAAVFTIE